MKRRCSQSMNCMYPTVLSGGFAAARLRFAAVRRLPLSAPMAPSRRRSCARSAICCRGPARFASMVYRPTTRRRTAWRARAFCICRKTAEFLRPRPSSKISNLPSTVTSTRPFAAAVEDAFSHFPQLKERQNQAAGNLSGGEQQMLALARAIISTPKILLLDEPSLGLSPRMVREAYRVLHGFKTRGMAILLVEQNVHAALRFANRGYVLRQGAIVRQGDAAALAADSELFKQYLVFT